jgi:2-polyprenyl-3-methyl-5-hydroxy-6-metoxy-1,4-benzoquinol methylase
MAINCNVCHTPLVRPVYESSADKSLTSLCQIVDGRTSVWNCPQCGHIMTQQLLDARQYYAQDYKILLSHDDEDQIYESVNGQLVYRTQHQLKTLNAKLNLSTGSRVLDYGCAKAAMPKLLLAQKPDLQIHLFDVSEMYREHWTRFLQSERWAIHHIPQEWQGSFDAVTSFFALEHIDHPVQSMKTVASLLRQDGVFYGIVPDTIGNVADFIVIDHVNHFTPASLHHALSLAGFVEIHIDRNVHRGALVFTARLQGLANQEPSVQDAEQHAFQLATYWKKISQQLTHARMHWAQQPSAIYGSGFYGAYIASSLGQDADLRCFLDASPYQQGKTILDLPVLAPQSLPDGVQILYVGLNPSIARQVMSHMSWMQERELQLVFLDGEDHA